jgi:hypothetical protein
MRPESPRPEFEEPFWHLDEALDELELQERPSGPDLYTVRLKAHTDSVSYYADRELYPLQRDGTKHAHELA